MRVQEQGHAPHKQDDAQRERSDSPSVLRAELEIPEAVINEYKANQRKDDRREWWRFFVEVLGFILVVVLAAFSYEQLTLTRNQMRAAERAWVTVKIATVVDSRTDNTDRPIEIATGEAPMLSVEIQNTGHSPARETVILTAVDFLDQLPAGDSFPIAILKTAAQLKLDANNTGRSVFGPGAPMFATVHLMRPLTAKELADLKTGTGRALAVFGMIDYDDVFAQHHVTTFCYRTVNGRNALGPCAKWNYAD